MNYSQLVEQIRQKESFLCVGLDTDYKKIPADVKTAMIDDSMLFFNTQIIKATAPYAVAYKLNVAFYESQGIAGWKVLAETIRFIQDNYPDIFIIADAKRGDIGNTSAMYAKAMFDELQADAVTVVPYMGQDSIAPFLAHENRWTIILALTSNTGSEDFQTLLAQEDELGSPILEHNGEGEMVPATATKAMLEKTRLEAEPLYQKVLATASSWGTTENTMFVVGATHAEMLTDVRKIVPKHFLLVPGVGAQGGSLEDVAKYGMTADCGLLVNSSRGIIYAGQDANFADTAAQKAAELQQQMAALLHTYSKL